MAIKFRCPQCNKSFTVKDENAGKKAKCPCGAKLVVPSDHAPAQSPQEKYTQKDNITNRQSCQQVIKSNNVQKENSLSLASQSQLNMELDSEWLNIVSRNSFFMFTPHDLIQVRSNRLNVDLFDSEGKELLIQMKPRPGFHDYKIIFYPIAPVIAKGYLPKIIIDIKSKLEAKKSFFTVRTGRKNRFILYDPRPCFEVLTPKGKYGSMFMLLSGRWCMFDSNKHELLQIEIEQDKESGCVLFYSNEDIIMKIILTSMSNHFISFTELTSTNTTVRSLLLIFALMVKYYYILDMRLNVANKHKSKQIKQLKDNCIEVVPANIDKIIFHCETCSQKIIISQIHTGKKVKCPKCHNIIIVPSNKITQSGQLNGSSELHSILEKMQKVKSAYKPSGKTSALGIMWMLLAIPFSTILGTAVGMVVGTLFGLFFGFCWFILSLFKEFFIANIFGIIGVIIGSATGFCMAGATAGTVVAYAGSLSKNRNIPIAATLGIVSTLLILCLVFWWGYILAYIPINTLSIAAFIIGSFFALLSVYGGAAKRITYQKFCEECDVYLKKYKLNSLSYFGTAMTIQALSDNYIDKARSIMEKEIGDKGMPIVYICPKCGNGFFEI